MYVRQQIQQYALLLKENRSPVNVDDINEDDNDLSSKPGLLEAKSGDDVKQNSNDVEDESVNQNDDEMRNEGVKQKGNAVDERKSKHVRKSAKHD